MRYSRQEIFVGTRKQKILEKSLVTIVGCGGLGSAAAEYLARAGVNLRLVDRDIVELSNLQRQLYREADIGRPKAESLKDRLEEINSDIKLDAINDDLNPSNIARYLAGSSLVLDGLDNLDTRFLLNDFCLKNKIPFTYSAAIKNEALFTLIVPKETPCLRCFLPSAPAGSLDTCETSGVLGPVVGTIGIISAVEAIKYLTKSGTSIAGNMLHINFYKNVYELIELKKNKKCPACCGNYEFLNTPQQQITQLCGGTYQFIFENPVHVSDLCKKLGKTKDFEVMDSGRHIAKIRHKNYFISLFQNRMIVQNARSEKDVKILAAKILGV